MMFTRRTCVALFILTPTDEITRHMSAIHPRRKAPWSGWEPSSALFMAGDCRWRSERKSSTELWKMEWTAGVAGVVFRPSLGSIILLSSRFSFSPLTVQPAAVPGSNLSGIVRARPKEETKNCPSALQQSYNEDPTELMKKRVDCHVMDAWGW